MDCGLGMVRCSVYVSSYCWFHCLRFILLVPSLTCRRLLALTLEISSCPGALTYPCGFWGYPHEIGQLLGSDYETGLLRTNLYVDKH